ncbi:hypothetical protein DL93DRAFT_2227714 [Clavulina sp. PMI_390]|nr:hypothetical protein DL93DRAFT_2227714 [Clavulina sp. PMI_390]
MTESVVSTSLDSSSWFDVTAAQLLSGAADVSFPFTPEVNDAIRARRAALDGTLFFDELLILAGLGEAADNFPPSSPADLATLVSEIDKCDEWEQLRRDCLCYYLLKFWPVPVEDGQGRAAHYRSARLIPLGFAILADAYFHLDEGDSESAVMCLTDMRVQPDFVPKIMQSLSLSALPSLVLRFVRLAKPPLTDQASLEIYVGALCSVNIPEAIEYARKFPESTDETAQRPRLTGMILNSCLMPKPRPDALNTLLSFPLTAYEQVVLNTYALRPPAALPEPSLAILQDLIIVRLMHQGRYSDAITLDKLFVAESARAGRVGPGAGAVNKAAEARREMFQEVLDVLPAIQRKLLDVSLDEQPVQTTTAPQSAPPADLTMSWEELGQSTYTLASSVHSLRGTQSSQPPPIPRTPLSASASLRRAADPKVAVYRAFAQARLATPTLGSSVAGGSSRGAMLEGSPAPGLRQSYLAQSTLGESTSGARPSSPFNATSPFASRPRLSYTPVRQPVAQPNFGAAVANRSSVRRHPLQESFSSSTMDFEGSPGPKAPALNGNGFARPKAVDKPSAVPSSDSWGASLFGPKRGTSSTAAPAVERDIDGAQAFKPSRTLMHTPAVQHTYKAAPSSMDAPTIPSLSTHLQFGQSTLTPTKKRGHDEMQDLWQGDGSDEKMEFVVSSDEEEAPIRTTRPRHGSNDPVPYRNGNGNGNGHALFAEKDAPIDYATNDTPQETLAGNDDDDDLDMEDEAEAAAELLATETGSELPGAFPHDVDLDVDAKPPEKQSTRRPPRTRQRDIEQHVAMSTWVAGDHHEPEMRQVESSKPVSRSSRAPSSSASSAAPPAIQKGKGKSAAGTTAAASKPRTTARSTGSRQSRASSVVSEAVTEEDDDGSKPSLRRSSRLSAAPSSSDAEPPKSKKLRASQSPTREGSADSTKRKGRSRGGSSGPSTSGGATSSRLRRGAPTLPSLKE